MFIIKQRGKVLGSWQGELPMALGDPLGSLSTR